MSDDAQHLLRSCWQFLLTRIRRHADKLKQCRACGRKTEWFSDMCDNCGTSDPVVVPKRYLCAATLLAVLLLMLAVWCL
jgi:hypothetical protein